MYRQLAFLFLILAFAGCQSAPFEFLSSTKKDARFKIRSQGKTGYIDSHGEIIIPALFDFGHDFSNGLAMFEQENKVGYLKPDGTKLVEATYGLDSRSFSENRAAVKVLETGSLSKGKMGYIDQNGLLIILDMYERARDFSNGLAAVRKNGLWGFIDPLGSSIIEPTYVSVGQFSEGYCSVVNEAGQVGYIDQLGNWVLPPVYLEALEFHNGRACVLGKASDQSEAWGVINTDGEPIVGFGGIANDRIDLPMYAEGLLAAIDPTSGKFGYLDTNGEWAIEPGFDEAKPFSEGLAAVFASNRWTYIDEKGKPRIEGLQILEGGAFKNGLAPVQDVHGNWSNYIDTKGNYVYRSN
ncbi:MAG: WG repeat-containing protein [Bacteroidota bacterium]